MPSTTSRRPRSTAVQARFARGPARPPGRTSRAPFPGRFGRANAPTSGRFGRASVPSPGRFGRPSQQRTAGRPTIVTRGRRQQKPTGIKGMFSALPVVGSGSKRKGMGKSPSDAVKGMLAALPGVGGGTKRRRSSSASGRRKAGGAALVAGAAGLAIKNRDKVSSMLQGRTHEDEASRGAMPEAAAGAGTTTPTPATDVTPADVAPPPAAAGDTKPEGQETPGTTS
jgi:hypothetical protein